MASVDGHHIVESARWRIAGEKDVPSLTAEIARWQGKLWTPAHIGSYVRAEGKGYAENLTRQVAAEPGVSPLLGVMALPLELAAIPGHPDFRRAFPLFICFPPVVANDEVVSLKMFHREDEPLIQLFLDDPQRVRLEQLWA